MEEKSPSPWALWRASFDNGGNVEAAGAGPNTVPGVQFFENWLWSYNIEWFVRLALLTVVDTVLAVVA